VGAVGIRQTRTARRLVMRLELGVRLADAYAIFRGAG